MNNLVWLADHDKDALLALIACQHHTCDDCSFAKYPACEAQGGYSKWLWAEHVDDNDSIECSMESDSDQRELESDSREKLEVDAWEFVSNAWRAGCNFEQGKTPDGWDSDELTALLDRQAAITRRELAKSSQDDYWDDCSTCEEVDHLLKENMKLASDLGACMAERDELKLKLNTVIDANSEYRDALEKTRAEREALRKNLGAVLDAAQEIRRIGALYGVD